MKMGSVIGAVASVQQYRKQTKALERMEAKAAEVDKEAASEKERTKKLTPATAQNPDVGDSVFTEVKRRKGVQSTFTATPSYDKIGS